MAMRRDCLGLLLAILAAIAVAALAVPIAGPGPSGAASSLLDQAAAHPAASHPHVALVSGMRTLSVMGVPQTVVAAAAAAALSYAVAHGLPPLSGMRDHVPTPGRRGRALLQAYLN
jgi:hypothetical protein